MSSTYVSPALRQRLRSESGRRCAYCQSSEVLSGMPPEVEHIIPRAHRGKTSFNNLCLACHRCNEYKGDRVEAMDPVTGEAVPLFNPRLQRWSEHFKWSRDGAGIVGTTPCGRATAEALRLNNEDIVAARHIWVMVGFHPPIE